MRIRPTIYARFLTVLFLVLGLAEPLGGQSGTRYTTAALRLRAQPSTAAVSLLTMPRGAGVTVGRCADAWCRVEYRGRSGYAAQRYLSQTRPAVRRAVRSTPECGTSGYVNSRGRWVPSPCHSPVGPPAGASARCRDGTYSFSRSRRGTCSHHGGVARWL